MTQINPFLLQPLIIMISIKPARDTYIGKMSSSLKLLIKKYIPKLASGPIEGLSNFYNYCAKIIIFKVRISLGHSLVE